ncbi:MAG TPA: hypothetical protein VK438_04485 [Xanthobacteraceae bacterium]|nr:hypothetical protein [Xanthobacteraceae bacterium]
MVGITLSAEQIREAPREVRHWLEQQVLTSFGWQLPAAQPGARKLVACSAEDAFKALSLIREMIPVVNVFFELGHAGTSVGDGLEAFRLADIQRHVRLGDVAQVQQCLEAINDALRRARSDDEATFVAEDDRGHCFVAEETQRSIARVWQQLVAERSGARAASAAPAQSVAPPPGAMASTYPVWSAPARPMDASLSRTMDKGKGV